MTEAHLERKQSENNKQRLVRAHWSFHRRVLAVIVEEGFLGVMKRICFQLHFLVLKYFKMEPVSAYGDDFYLETHRNNRYTQLLADQIYKALMPESFLDVGCGDGLLLTYLSNYPVILLGLDGGEVAIEKASQKFLAIKADLSERLTCQGRQIFSESVRIVRDEKR